jgi:hypothetical protein
MSQMNPAYIIIFYIFRRSILILSFSIFSGKERERGCEKRAIKEGTEAISQSQWPRGVRHDVSSPAQMLGSWV